LGLPLSIIVVVVGAADCHLLAVPDAMMGHL
jgi:hypothetical protein